MDDLISRQAAIDAVKRIMGDRELSITVQTGLHILPSAQPVVTDTNVGDTISRQQAIDTIYAVINPDASWVAESILRNIEQLPSAQPEYRLDEWCHDCKEYDQEHHCCPRFNRVISESLKDVQPEPNEGRWIPHEGIDGDIQYECSRCGVLWEFNDGSPEDNEAYFCPKCGSYLGGGQK